MITLQIAGIGGLLVHSLGPSKDKIFLERKLQKPSLPEPLPKSSSILCF